jgi:hypothetical protein
VSTLIAAHESHVPTSLRWASALGLALAVFATTAAVASHRAAALPQVYLAIQGSAPLSPTSLTPKADEPTYWKDIRPIFQKNCTICHSPKNTSKKEIGGGLALTSFDSTLKDPKEPVIEPGNSADSKLFRLLATKDEEKRMPKDGDPLGESDIELIRKWIDSGAKEGERPAQPATEPTVRAASRRPSTLARALDFVLPTTATVPPDVAKQLSLPEAAPDATLELAVKVGPLPSVTALMFAADGKWLAVGSYGTIAIWDLAKGELIKSIDTSGAVHSLALTNDGTRLAAAGGQPARAGEVLIFDTANWQLVATLTEHSDVVYDAAFSPDGTKLATASLDKTVRIWSMPDAKPLQVLKGHSDFVYGVTFTPDGKHLLSCSKDRSIKVHDAETWETERTLSGHNEEVLAIATSGDSYNVVSAGKEPQLRWWIIENGQNNRSMSGHTGYVNQIVFSHDGQRIASAGQDKQVRIWDGSDGKLLRTIAGSTEWLYAVALSADRKIVAAGSWDGLVRLWDVETGRALATFIAPLGPDPERLQWIAVTPQGFFQASDEMAALARWRLGSHSITGDFFTSKLRQSEPVLRSLRGEEIESPKFE